MEQRMLGQQGLRVSALGLGCMGMSEFYGAHDDATSTATIHRAIDLGVTFIDTADMYGVGHNEELLGRAIKGRRDGLIIAFLALDPVRRRNLADLVLGRTLLRHTSGWLIAFTADDTKTHTVHEVPLPDTLVVPLEAYLEVWRPILEARTGRWIKSVGGALWVSKDRSPMTQMALYDRIRARTKAKWGKAINPHLFRDAAATTLSIVDPGHVRIAASVLGHRSFGTTEKYYNQAKGYEAQRSFHDMIVGIREGGDGVS